MESEHNTKRLYKSVRQTREKTFTIILYTWAK